MKTKKIYEFIIIALMIALFATLLLFMLDKQEQVAFYQDMVNENKQILDALQKAKK